LPAVFIGLVVLAWLPESLDDVRSLTLRERSILRKGVTPIVPHGVVDTLRAVVSESRFAAWALVFFCYNIGSSAVKIWQPTILRNLAPDASAMTIGAMTAIPGVVGALAILLVGYSSKRLGERKWHITAPLVAGAIGLLWLSTASTTASAVAAAALVFAAVACQPPLFASVTAISEGHTKAAGVAYVNSLAMLGSFVGPSIVGMVTQIGLGGSAYAAFGLLWACAAAFNLRIEDKQSGPAQQLSVAKSTV
jgi:MFS family permease